jgi:hypothetical protein
MITKTEAKILGKALLRRMKGKGWKLNLWENLGWHYSVHLGGLSINPLQERCNTLYFALLSNGDYVGTGEMYWTDRFCCSNPNTAVKHQTKLAEEFSAKTVTTIESIKKGLMVKAEKK